MRLDILTNIADVEQQVFASLHSDLEFHQIYSERRTVFKCGSAKPVVWAFVFTYTHVRESTAECIEFPEVQVRERRIGCVGRRRNTCVDCFCTGYDDGSLNTEDLLFTCSHIANIPYEFASFNGSNSGVLKRQFVWKRASNGDTLDSHRGRVFNFEFQCDRATLFTRCD